MKIHNKSVFILFLLIPLATGVLSALLSGSTFLYSTLKVPPASPPAFLFPIVWTILFVLMGVSSYLIYMSENANRRKALIIYALQLIVNFCWSIIFFQFAAYLFSFIWLVLLILLVVTMIIFFYTVRPLAAYLQIPYLLWCIFAAYLNFGIYYLNVLHKP